jgi:hypothetical protein
VEIETAVSVFLGLNFSAETILLLLYSLCDYLIETVKCTAYDEKDICGIDLNALFVRMLSAALRGNICNSTLKDLKLCLLDTLT